MNRRFLLATLMSWLIFIMIDFVFHGALLTVGAFFIGIILGVLVQNL